jgi:trehalose 6-phosphate phosphatase
LLDLAPTPEEVRVPDGLLETLGRLVARSNGALALVSGRALASIDSLFAPLQTAAIGCHGAQLRPSATAGVETRVSTMPAAIRHAFSDVAMKFSDVRVEDKTFAMAFHYRQARATEKALLLQLRERLAPFESDFALMAGKSVFEIKPRRCDKGESLRALMRFLPFAGRRPIYFGDDTTDKYAFAALPDFGGVGISVGRRVPHATFKVNAPRDVRHWLEILTT